MAALSVLLLLPISRMVDVNLAHIMIVRAQLVLHLLDVLLVILLDFIWQKLRQPILQVGVETAENSITIAKPVMLIIVPHAHLLVQLPLPKPS